MIAVLFAPGFEEIEAITVTDVLRRAELDVCMLGVGAKTIVGAHQISVLCDELIGSGDAEFEMLILPGGMPGAANLLDSEAVRSLITGVYDRGGYLAAICAAPMVFGEMGLLEGKKAVCYPGFESRLKGARVVLDDVVTDGKIITSRGAGTALPFAFRLTALLKNPECARTLSAQMLYD